jgi:uncharacterized RDD family membrane protein YckC
MVFGDLSQYSPQNENFEKRNLNNRIAPVADRVLALFFDILLATPIFSFILYPLSVKLENQFYIDANSSEFTVFLILNALAYLFLWTVFQTVSLYFFGTTPGKHIAKIKVISIKSFEGQYESQKNIESLSIFQCLQRSFTWSFEALLFCIPYFEVLSHPLRRPLHDRSAETMVITLKQQGDLGPHPLETRFVRNMMVMTFSLFAFWSVTKSFALYTAAKEHQFKMIEVEKGENLCSQITETTTDYYSRIDLALSRFLAKEVDATCLEKETNFVLWTQSSDLKSWGYLAQSYLVNYDKALKSQYLNKVCAEDQDSSACLIAKNNFENKTLTAKVLQIQKLNENIEYKKALDTLRDLSAVPGFSDFIQAESVKAFWYLEKPLEAKGAYLNSILHINNEQQKSLAAWMCHQQTQTSCKPHSYAACDDLEQIVLESGSEDLDLDSATALVKARDCQGTDKMKLVLLQSPIEKYKSFKKWLEIVNRASTQDKNARNHERDRAELELIIKDASSPNVMKREAMVTMLRLSGSGADLEKAYNIANGNFKTAQEKKEILHFVELRRGQLTNKNRLPASIKEGL